MDDDTEVSRTGVDGSAEVGSDDSARAAAIKRLKNRRGSWQNLLCYVVINSFVVAIWTAFVQRPITESDVEREIRRGRDSVA